VSRSGVRRRRKTPDNARMRMLYVEDNRINALLFEELVQLRSDIELRIAEDGHEALGIATAWSPDVLVLDAHLPDVNGVELLATLRTLPGLAGVPAFMCSADSQPADLQRADAAGFCGYWPKPIAIACVLADLDALSEDRPRSA
jgi:CheY-like chemotaxis protein